LVKHAAWCIAPYKAKPKKGLEHQAPYEAIEWKIPVIVQIQNIKVMAGMS
jgi:hypothetical protein